MNKMQMAHDYALEMLKETLPTGSLYGGEAKSVAESIVKSAFALADMMQDEADKREDKTRPEVLEEWQPDWSQAPDGYNYWVATADRSGKISGGWFYDVKPEIGKSDGVSIYYSSNSSAVSTESFNYQGNWKNSLRKRPQ